MGLLMEPASTYYGRDVERSVQAADQNPSSTMNIPSQPYYAFTVDTRETEFGKIVEPIPIRGLKPIRPPYTTFFNGCIGVPQQNGFVAPPNIQEVGTQLKVQQRATPQIQEIASPIKDSTRQAQKNYKKPAIDDDLIRPPPKKKWIKAYLEEEPRPLSPVTVLTRANGLLVHRVPSPPQPVAAIPIIDFHIEHSRPRTDNGPTIPSPPPSISGASIASTSSASSGISLVSNSSGSSSSGLGPSMPRAGTREVHNKLEKNRRAHLKECFEMLKRQLPPTPDDKKTSNLSILGSAIRYIQVLRRKERELEHEMERLAREKIAAQQRLANLKRDISSRVISPQRPPDAVVFEEREGEERVNDQVLGIPISITSGRGGADRASRVNVSTKLRAVPIHIASTSSQSGQVSESTMNPSIGPATALVHPAHLHLPISQVVNGNGVVVGGALQLVGGGVRVLPALPALPPRALLPAHPQAPAPALTPPLPVHRHIQRAAPESSSGSNGVVMAPLVVSQPASGAHLLQTHTLTHKMVETQVVKGAVTPLTVSAQYLSATTIVKPMVVVSAPATSSSSSS